MIETTITYSRNGKIRTTTLNGRTAPSQSNVKFAAFENELSSGGKIASRAAGLSLDVVLELMDIVIIEVSTSQET